MNRVAQIDPGRAQKVRPRHLLVTRDENVRALPAEQGPEDRGRVNDVGSAGQREAIGGRIVNVGGDLQQAMHAGRVHVGGIKRNFADGQGTAGLRAQHEVGGIGKEAQRRPGHKIGR